MYSHDCQSVLSPKNLASVKDLSPEDLKVFHPVIGELTALQSRDEMQDRHRWDELPLQQYAWAASEASYPTLLVAGQGLQLQIWGLRTNA
jgi:hypothetical protein